MKNKETFKQFVINYINNKVKTLLEESNLSIIKAISKRLDKTDEHITMRGNKTDEHVTKEAKSTRKLFRKKIYSLYKGQQEILESQKRIESKIDYLYEQLNIKYEEDKRTNVQILKSLSSFPYLSENTTETNTPF